MVSADRKMVTMPQGRIPGSDSERGVRTQASGIVAC